jgi:hypothetical protein
MAKVPPQFEKKKAPVPTDIPTDAPNAEQDPAMQAARDAMMKKGKKGALIKKGMKPS